MKITSFSFDKLTWLFSNSVFKKNPIKVLWRIFFWECLRVFNHSIYFIFDKSSEVILRPNEGVSRLTFYFDVSEPELFSFYNQFLKRGMVVFDLGANIGLHSIFMAKRVQADGTVFSFEPSSKIFKRLEENVLRAKMDNIILVNAACGLAQGRANFSLNEGDTSRSFCVEKNKGESVFVSGEDVNVVCLDIFCEQNRVNKIDFLKLDVEGYELNILKGAIRLLQTQKVDCIQVELDEKSLKRQGTTILSLMDWISSFKYFPTQWDNITQSFSLIPISGNFPYNTFLISSFYYNFYCCNQKK